MHIFPHEYVVKGTLYKRDLQQTECVEKVVKVCIDKVVKLKANQLFVQRKSFFH